MLEDSDDEEDNHVIYGTPLEPIDPDTVVRKKPLLLEEQEVRDENGRKRFHGAFTGGFSAGFYNTVGSLEGWTPSVFKSSKSDRIQARSQRPQDFMDAEDIGEFGIAPTVLQANKDYAKAGVNKRKRPEALILSDRPIPGTPVLSNFLCPVRETVGVRLLKTMGWKPGQGVGPRLTKVEKIRHKKKVYGCAMQPDAAGAQSNEISDDDDDDELDGLNLDKLTFAPDDWEPFVGHPKDNTFGMGYIGLDRKSILGSSNISSGLNLQEKNRKVNIRGQAFGVGAFEEDDEDIYTVEDMSQYDKSLETLVGESADVEARKYRHEGVLEGFVPSRGTGISKRLFPPPVLPRDFVPKAMARRSRFEPAPSTVPEPGKGRHDLSSVDRSVLIGDISPEEVASRAQAEARVLTEKLILTVELQSSNYKPFLGDLEKQARYEQYLKLTQLGHKERLYSLQPVTMTSWAKEREKIEFEQAAKLFKPLTGVMSDRFTRPSQPDDLNDPMAAVDKTLTGNLDMRNAAKAKMFGRLTRLEDEWKPCSLLCKRFNIPEPNVNVKNVKKKTSYSIFDSLDETVLKQEPEQSKEEKETQDIAPSAQDIAPSAMQQTEPRPPVSRLPRHLTSEPETFVEPQNKVDLFKAIFMDSDEEEVNPEPSGSVAEPPAPLNTKRNTSPARGLFENVDLESLQVRATPAKQPEPQSEPLPTPAPHQQATVAPALDPAFYGPKLPDKISSNSSAPKLEPRSASSSPEMWIEKSKKSKKSKKKKSKDHKHKHKHKKHRR